MYFLQSILVAANTDVSRRILVLGTSILVANNMDRSTANGYINQTDLIFIIQLVLCWNKIMHVQCSIQVIKSQQP
jgi:hypothetical protein